MQHHLRPRRLLLGLALSLAVTGAAACGDDDDEAGADTTDQLGGEAAVPAEACDAYVGLSGAMAGDPSAAGDVIDAFVGSAPDGLSQDAATMAATYGAMAEGGGPAAFPEPEFAAAPAADRQDGVSGRGVSGRVERGGQRDNQ